MAGRRGCSPLPSFPSSGALSHGPFPAFPAAAQERLTTKFLVLRVPGKQQLAVTAMTLVSDKPVEEPEYQVLQSNRINAVSRDRAEEALNNLHSARK